ncbi:Aste57867_12108 [Aphanomyces stellatus]|uniref:Aste57867_12108 protein n=1 Tax=Aphanomyces stellatus TaxID=120398 RepID=A0A485KUP2_9STRA|nr:hypothetical protein As57867_012063 [Aphanomyces stellatus]VFT88962.1 Aste57867_12108 [Aphanomyces stellatus]
MTSSSSIMQTQFIVEKELAKAIFGKILLCTDKATKERVVVKRLHIDSAKKQKSLVGFAKVLEDAEMEKRVHRALRDVGGHPHVLRLLKDFVEDGHDHFVLEYCARGELFHELESLPHNRLGPKRALECFEQITQSLAFLHSQGFAHGDLSLENVFVAADGTCKLGDMGLSTETKMQKRHAGGKFFYMAPELYVGTVEYDPVKADIWSLGIVLFMMLTGTPLFEKANPSDAGFRFVKSKGLRTICKEWQVDHLVPPDAMHLLDHMLQIQPTDRWSVDQIRAHPYVQAVAADSAATTALTALLHQCTLASQSTHNGTTAVRGA